MVIRGRFVRSGLAAAALSVVAPGVAEVRQPITVADERLGCPSVTGTFVVLLDTDRGALLMSTAPFPGGQGVGEARGEPVRFVVSDSQAWTISSLGSADRPQEVWAASYPFRGIAGSGCVAFDKQRFSSEGDLVSYMRWLSEEIYLQIPAVERARWPAFELLSRQVRLRIEQSGFKPLELAGKEGSTLAFRTAGSEQTMLLMPFVLDAASARLALKMARTDKAYWQGADKEDLGWLVVTQSAPVTLETPSVTIVVESVSAP